MKIYSLKIRISWIIRFWWNKNITPDRKLALHCLFTHIANDYDAKLVFFSVYCSFMCAAQRKNLDFVCWMHFFMIFSSIREIFYPLPLTLTLTVFLSKFYMFVLLLLYIFFLAFHSNGNRSENRNNIKKPTDTVTIVDWLMQFSWRWSNGGVVFLSRKISNWAWMWGANDLFCNTFRCESMTASTVNLLSSAFLIFFLLWI